jgi:hypothetical protein
MMKFKVFPSHDKNVGFEGQSAARQLVNNPIQLVASTV